MDFFASFQFSLLRGEGAGRWEVDCGLQQSVKTCFVVCSFNLELFIEYLSYSKPQARYWKYIGKVKSLSSGNFLSRRISGAIRIFFWSSRYAHAIFHHGVFEIPVF